MVASTAIVRGSVVLVRFPFSDLSATKLRPAVVLAEIDRQDLILVQVTSRPYSDTDSVELDESAFASGSLQRISYARPGKLFTAHISLIEHTVGQLTDGALDSTRSAIVGLISGRGAAAR